MNLKERNDFIREFFEERCIIELEKKGHDYSHGGKEDVSANRNFREIASLLGVSPFLVWGIHFWKHLDAILGWVKGSKLKSEGVYYRITDAVNYLLILASMIKESEESTE